MQVGGGSGVGPGDDKRAEAKRAVPKEEEITAEVAKEAMGASFSDMLPELKSLIYQAMEFDDWYDPILHAMLQVSTEWNTLIKKSLLTSGDKIDLFVSQILKKAHYNLANVEEGVRDILTSDACRLKVHTLRPSRNVTDAELLVLCQNFRNVGVLELSNEAFALTPEGIKNALLVCQQLTELSIGHPQDITDTFLEEISEGCTHLKRFELGSWTPNISNAQLAAFLQSCPALTHLLLPSRDDIGMLRDMSSLLTHLNIPDCQPDVTFFRSESAQKLTYLSLVSSASVTDQLLVALGENCKSLTSINLRSCTPFTAAGLQALLQGCPLIERLELSGEVVTDEMLQIIAEHGQNLKEIILPYCPNITDAGVLPIIVKFPLKVLDLTSCKEISDNTLQAVAEHLGALEQLKMGICQIFGQDKLLQVVLHCPKLKHLDIAGSGIMFSEEFAQTVAEHLKHLEELGIDQLESPQALENLLPACTKLTTLHISSAAVIGDAELARIAKTCKKLRTITLYSTACTTKGIRDFLDKLRLLAFFTCSSRTDIRAERAMLSKDFPSVEISLQHALV